MHPDQDLEGITLFIMAVAETVLHLNRKVPGHNLPDMFDRNINRLRMGMARDSHGSFSEESSNDVRLLQAFLRHNLNHPVTPE